MSLLAQTASARKCFALELPDTLIKSKSRPKLSLNSTPVRCSMYQIELAFAHVHTNWCWKFEVALIGCRPKLLGLSCWQTPCNTTQLRAKKTSGCGRTQKIRRLPAAETHQSVADETLPMTCLRQSISWNESLQLSSLPLLCVLISCLSPLDYCSACCQRRYMILHIPQTVTFTCLELDVLIGASTEPLRRKDGIPRYNQRPGPPPAHAHAERPDCDHWLERTAADDTKPTSFKYCNPNVHASTIRPRKEKGKWRWLTKFAARISCATGPPNLSVVLGTKTRKTRTHDNNDENHFREMSNSCWRWWNVCDVVLKMGITQVVLIFGPHDIDRVQVVNDHSEYMSLPVQCGSRGHGVCLWLFATTLCCVVAKNNRHTMNTNTSLHMEIMTTRINWPRTHTVTRSRHQTHTSTKPWHTPPHSLQTDTHFTPTWHTQTQHNTKHHAFTVCVRIENDHQENCSSLGPHEISLCSELIIRHLALSFWRNSITSLCLPRKSNHPHEHEMRWDPAQDPAPSIPTHMQHSKPTNNTGIKHSSKPSLTFLELFLSHCHQHHLKLIKTTELLLKLRLTSSLTRLAPVFLVLWDGGVVETATLPVIDHLAALMSKDISLHLWRIHVLPELPRNLKKKRYSPVLWVPLPRRAPPAWWLSTTSS